MTGINLDILLGESEPKPLTYKGQTFDLPGELPAEVLVPFLADDLGLIELVAEALAAEDTPATEDAEGVTGWAKVIIDHLKAHKRLPVQLLNAMKESFRVLLDAEREGQYDAFLALKPSVNAYVALATSVGTEYGMSLTDFFGSGAPSDDGTETSKEISNSTTESTPEGSGGAHVGEPAVQPVGQYVPEPIPAPVAATPVAPAPADPSTSG